MRYNDLLSLINEKNFKRGTDVKRLKRIFKCFYDKLKECNKFKISRQRKNQIKKNILNKLSIYVDNELKKEIDILLNKKKILFSYEIVEYLRNNLKVDDVNIKILADVVVYTYLTKKFPYVKLGKNIYVLSTDKIYLYAVKLLYKTFLNKKQKGIETISYIKLINALKKKVSIPDEDIEVIIDKLSKLLGFVINKRINKIFLNKRDISTKIVKYYLAKYLKQGKRGFYYRDLLNDIDNLITKNQVINALNKLLKKKVIKRIFKGYYKFYKSK